RLYGNVFAGENLLEAMSNAVQHPAWARSVFSVLLPVPFYFLEILVGLVQAFVFMLLTTVFTALICTHEEEHRNTRIDAIEFRRFDRVRSREPLSNNQHITKGKLW